MDLTDIVISVAALVWGGLWVALAISVSRPDQKQE